MIEQSSTDSYGRKEQRLNGTKKVDGRIVLGLSSYFCSVWPVVKDFITNAMKNERIVSDLIYYVTCTNLYIRKTD